MVRRRSSSACRCACSTRSSSCAASRVLPERISALASAYRASVWCRGQFDGATQRRDRVCVPAGVQMNLTDAGMGVGIRRIDQENGDQLHEGVLRAVLSQERARELFAQALSLGRSATACVNASTAAGRSAEAEAS